MAFPIHSSFAICAAIGCSIAIMGCRKSATENGSFDASRDGGGGALVFDASVRDTGNITTISDGATGGVGADGTGGTGGTAGSPVPSCIADLVATCPLEGNCFGESQVDADASTVRRNCYDSGIVEEGEESGDCSHAARSGEWRVYRPDRSLCYSVAISYGQACENIRSIWYNAYGTEVARGASAWDVTRIGSWSFECLSGDGSSTSCSTTLSPMGDTSCDMWAGTRKSICALGACPK
jgi:hypothetical protein